MGDTERLERSFDPEEEEDATTNDEQQAANEFVDSKWGIAIVIGSFVINFVCVGTLYSFGILVDELKKEFDGYVSWILSLLTALGALSGPIASFLVNKYGCAAVIITGSILGAVGFLVASYAENVIILIWALGVGVGVAFAFTYYGIIVCIQTSFDKYRAFATGITVSAGGIGTFVIVPFISYLLRAYGWRRTFMVLSGMMLNCVWFGALFQLITPSARSRAELGNDIESQNLNLFKDPIFYLLSLSDFLVSFGYYFPYFSLVGRATQFGIPSTKASYLISIIGIVSTVSRLTTGYISDKPWAKRMYQLNTGLVICGISIAASAFCFDFESFVIFSIVFGYMDGIYITLQPVIVADLIGVERYERATGLIWLFDGVALLTGPVLFNFISSRLQSHSSGIGFVLAGIMIACGGLILYIIPILRYCVRRRQLQRENDRVDLLYDS